MSSSDIEKRGALLAAGIVLTISMLLNACRTESVVENAPATTQLTVVETTITIEAATATPITDVSASEPITQVPEFNTGIKSQYETPLIEVANPQGVDVKVKVITDVTLDPVIRKLQINEGWKNSEGLTAEQAIAKFASTSVYRVAVENNGYAGTYEDYITDLAKAQASGQLEDWVKVEITAKVNDLTTEIYDAKPVTMFPFYIDKGLILPSDVKTFTELDLVVVKVKDSNVDKILQEAKYAITGGRYGFGTSLSPDGILYGITGMPTARLDEATPGTMASGYMSLWSDSFVNGNANVIRSGYYYNKEMMQLLVTNIKNAKSESAFK